MIDNCCVTRGNMDPAMQEKVKSYLKELESEIAAEAQRRSIAPGFVPALHPCNTFCAVSQKYIYVVFTRKNAGQMPLQVWLDGRTMVVPNEPDIQPVIDSALRNFAFEDPEAFYVEAAVIDADEQERKATLREEARGCMDLVERRLKRPRAPFGYEFLQRTLDTFLDDHPDFEQNVFIAMRFRETEQFRDIDSAVRSTLEQYGMTAHRADDKMYSADGDLWHNVCAYMIGCRYAVCVFEEIEERKFNPNVAIEFGFLRALNRGVLLLKERRMPTMPTDMAGKLYRTFDSYRIPETISREIGCWAERDLGLKRKL